MRKILIVDDHNERYTECFDHLKRIFPNNILTSRRADKDDKGNSLNISDIDMLLVHRNNDFSSRLIQQARKKRLYIISYTGGDSSWRVEGKEIYANYDLHLRRNLKDFLETYFEGTLNFDILEYGKEEAERRRKALDVAEYTVPLTNISTALKSAFELENPDVFLEPENKDDEDIFLAAAKQILTPDFWNKMATTRGSVPDDETQRLLERFAQILRFLLRRLPPEGDFNCGDSLSECGSCFLCKIEYHKGKDSQFYRLYQKLQAYLG